jgi:hypothetical protein
MIVIVMPVVVTVTMVVRDRIMGVAMAVPFVEQEQHSSHH